MSDDAQQTTVSPSTKSKPNGLIAFISAIGAPRLAAMGAVALGMIGCFIFLMVRINQPHMTTLYSELSFEDSNQIIKKLDGLNIPYEIKHDGAVVLVPKADLFQVRMKLAEDGLPAGGAVGYEIFDNSNTLGATNFVQNVNHLRALEGELSRTIRAISSIKSARVHLVLPKRKLFEKTAPTPSASIVVKTRGKINSEQIGAIRHLVASAIENLDPSKVSIIDQNGRLLATAKDDGNSLLIGEGLEKTVALEQNTARRLESMLGQIVGPEHVRVQVSALLDFNRLTEQAEVYDPDGQVVVSTQAREENASSDEPTSNGAVSVGNELPKSTGAAGSNSSKSNRSKNEEITNFSNSKTIRTRTVEAGQVKRMSVAVLIDGTYTKGADGKPVYKARSPAELAEIKKLVATAIGFDEKRGDSVQVSNLQFAQASAEPGGVEAKSGMFDFTKADYFYIGELAVTFLLSLLFLLMVVRPLVKKILTPDEPEDLLELGANAIPNQANEAAGADAGSALEGTADSEVQLVKNKTALMVEDAKASGDIQAESIAQIGELVKQNPEEAGGVVRQWIAEDAA